MKQKLEEILARENWGRYLTEVEEVENPHLLMASINPNNWHIQISFDKRIQDLDKLLEKFDEKKLLGIKIGTNYFSGKDNLTNILRFAVQHEIGHWKYCPFHKDEKEEILSGISEGLANAGMDKKEVKRYTMRLTNLFADIIDNVSNMYRDQKKEEYQDGFLAFYAKEGLISPTGYSNSFYLFVDTTVKLGIDGDKMKNFASRFCKDYQRLNPTTREIIELLIEDENLARKAESQKLEIEEKVKVYHAIMDKSTWHEKAIRFAEIMAPYIKEDQDQNKSSSKDDYQEGNGSGSGEESEEESEGSEKESKNQKQKNRNGKGQQKAQDKKEGKGEDAIEKAKKEKALREMIRKSIEKGHDIGYADATIALDELYKSRAEQIIIQMMQKEGESMALPIGYASRSKMDEAFFDGNRIDWQNPEFGVDKDGKDEIQFLEKRAPLFHNKNGYEKGARVPDILFIIDTSGSMISGYDPIAGRGPYDMLLRSVYSVFKYLEMNDQIHQMKFGAILFDGKPNYFSGWHQFQHMDEVKGALLEPAGKSAYGGTELDKIVVQEATDERSGKKFWTILVSDGQIFNQRETMNALSYIAEAGNQLTFLNTEALGEGYVAQHVRALGGSVLDVSEPSKLPGLILQQTKNIFG